MKNKIKLEKEKATASYYKVAANHNSLSLMSSLRDISSVEETKDLLKTILKTSSWEQVSTVVLAFHTHLAIFTKQV